MDCGDRQRFDQSRNPRILYRPEMHCNVKIRHWVGFVAMVKPQFEAGKDQTNKGIIKNDSIRRQILKDFENWAKDLFVIIDKRDSDVAGAKGNQERFYLLKPIKSA